jgi:ceramide glucosyltransferase
MSSCLISALEQDYEKFEIIFCVASPADAAIAVAQELIEKYPKVDAKLLIGEDRYGPNPKINNLAKGYMAAKYDIVWVLDSNVWVSPGALRRSVEEFRRNPKIKIVHHLPMVMAICNDSSNWGARLDEMFMLTAHSKFYTAINQLAVAACVMGKSNLYRRSTLDAAVNKGFGEGIRDFALYIAEDNMIADAIWRAGGRSAMTSDTVVQPQRNVSYRGYVSRRVRWLRVRRYMVFFATLIEPTTESIVCGIMGSFALSVVAFQGSSTFSWTYFLLHLVVWCIIDYWNFHNLTAFANVEYSSGNAPYFMSRYYSPDVLVSGQPRPLREWLVVWAMRELLALPIWVKAMCGQTVMWRNRPFRIKPDLTAEEVLFS